MDDYIDKKPGGEYWGAIPPDLNNSNEDAIKNIEVSVSVNDLFAYAFYCNGNHIVHEINIKNNSENDANGLRIDITTDTDLIEPYSEVLVSIPAGKKIAIRPEIKVHAEYVATLTEMMDTLLTITVSKGDVVYFKESHQISVLAYDAWPSSKHVDNNTLAIYVVPNHPVVEVIRHDASVFLNKFSGDPAFDGYQSKDPNRIINMVASIFYALQKLNITYSVPPAGVIGQQRIRLADEIMSTRFGTCLDLTLLFAACLEQSGLRPLLIIIQGHIFLGVWLVEDKEAADMLVTDPSQLEKRIADGINEILLVECTAVCSGSEMSFDEARKAAEKTLSNHHEDFELFVDVKKARENRHFRPLPIRRSADGQISVDVEELALDSVQAPETIGNVIDVSEDISNKKLTKIDQWERKLLDLSMHNLLINVRPTSSILPLLVRDIAGFEDLLSSENDYEIVPRPIDWNKHNINAFNFESLTDFGPYGDLVDDEICQKRVFSWWPEKELNRLTTKLYRSSKISMEENGASTLYLTLGLLKYYEGKKVHYSPLLLIPIVFVRRAVNKGYVIQKRDDDTTINITLLEYLKQNFDMDILGLNPPPQDEHGVDVKKVFATIRRAIMDREKWDVVETAFVANYSFSQFVMWNDIHSRSDLLAQNKIVRSLMDGTLAWDGSVPEGVDDDDTFLPVPVDASQLHAVKMAANGVSFVLHGPPGTGKSQTITALIANALSKGKTVLFVAEKRVALEVVQKRLASLGIADFCLELHSNKAVKRTVLDQLKRSVDIRVWGMSTDYERKISRIHQMRESLDAYVQALHKRQPCGKSIRELIDAYEALPDTDSFIQLDVQIIERMTPDDFDKVGFNISRLISAGKNLGSIKTNALSEIRQTEYSHSFKKRLDEVIMDSHKAVDSLENSARKFVAAIECDLPLSSKEWNDLMKYAQVLTGKTDIHSINQDDNAYYAKKTSLLAYKQAEQRAKAFNESFASKYDERILSVDLTAISKRYAESQKKFIGKSKAIESVKNELQSYVKFPVSPEQIPSIEVDIRNYHQINEDFLLIKEQTGINGSERYEEIVASAELYIRSYSEYIEIERNLGELLNISFYNEENWIGSRRELVQRIQEHESELRDWIYYQNVRKECVDGGLEEVCNAYENGYDAEKLEVVYLKSAYKKLIWEYIENDPTLDHFAGNQFNEQIRQYKEAEEELLSLTKEEMYYRLTHNLPSGHENTTISRELTLLRKAISSGGRGLSLRSLFDQIPHVLTRLCPCLLMSPMSVAQYLPVDSDLFDIVVFDEASQLPTSQAVGVLARGKDAIIVGDPNQLPPTSFFSGTVLDEDNLEWEDLDSILDDCLALGMPEAHLQWHYRSRHESLIAFSNKEFYDMNMLTFPSVNDSERHVRLCTVNGVYCRKQERKNFKEGEAVVKEVLRRYQDADLKEQSIGIVTFNIKQRELIEDLLDEESKKDPAFDDWMHNREEELFVKNLENVQGDERDVILFSIGFGPDEEGRISYNFGPLNKDGGWKRLNVAVSRARKDMIVFSSMTPDMIDTNRTSAKGVLELKAFLKYAESGILVNRRYNEDYRESGIILKICDTLTRNGFVVQKGIGSSDLKIDIAVVNPFDSNEYLLGIILDGKSYEMAKTTKDREIAQIEVLKGLGWNLHRIWTMDWWDNSEKVLAELLEVLSALRSDAEKRSLTSKKKDIGPISEEIVYTKPVSTKKREKKDTEKEPINTRFDIDDKFHLINKRDKS